MKYNSFIKRSMQLCILLLLVSCSGNSQKELTILETTDLHGVLFPYDFIEKAPIDYSLAAVQGYINQSGLKKEEYILLDNGDNLQGQPTAYYYNFIDTISPHINALVMNYMGYDAITVGNHDIEAGHSVYDRIKNQYDFPMLAANAVRTDNGEPYFKPYAIIFKNGVKVAVLGLVTPSIPDWLPPELYSGMKFEDMVETARKWMPVIEAEKPDIVVGLFHSGWNKNYSPSSTDRQFDENGSAAVAYNVPGFDIIFNGHDHATANEKIVNKSGDTVLVIDGGSRAEIIGYAKINLSKKINGSRKITQMNGDLIKVKDYKPDPGYMKEFEVNQKTIKDYVDKEIGESMQSVSSRDAFFGPSAFTDMVHSIQLELTGADVSFSAPLSFDVEIKKGKITVSDMFKLYRFENMLYTMELTGEEILKYLEYSYSLWFNTIGKKSGNLLNFRTGADGKPVIVNGRARLRNQSYNFDSGAGLNYVVDVSKPVGSRITILSLSNGDKFELNKTYKVAVNSYRGNGGGGHFTEGAGLTQEELRKRLIKSTERDLRYYLMKHIEEKKIINPEPLNNWKIVPEKGLDSIIENDYKLLFGEN